MRYLILLPIFFIPFLSHSQDARDLVRFSQTQVFGSARFESMAGAFGALGSDLSTSSINPAGYARYSSSVFGLGFQNTSIHNKTVFNTTENKTDLNSFNMNNLGFVITQDVSANNRGFIFQQFGFSYNRVQNFRDEIFYSGQQYKSLLDEFCSLGQGVPTTEIYDALPFSTALAWDTYAIDDNSNGGYDPRLSADTEVKHRRTIKTKGGISEYNFNFSANYTNKLYIGANMGIRSAKYNEDYVHYEQVVNTQGYDLDSFQYEYHLQTKGPGINLKLGVIYLPRGNFRLGLSIHTPTFFSMTDHFSADMTAYHTDSTYSIPAEFKPVGAYKYRLRTPPKVIGSVAYIFGTRGSVNLDLEYVNYDLAHFKSTKDTAYVPYDFKTENKDARSQLRSVVNVRLGGELVFQSQYFLRAGLALYPSAYDQGTDEQKANPTKTTVIYSAGIGFKWKKNSIDLALKIDHRNFNYYAFPASITNVSALRSGIIFNYSIGF